MRGPHRKGVRYFGPYAHAWAIRETLDLLLRVFPARTCSAGVFRRSPADRPAVPARLHRQVLGAVRRPGRPRRSTGEIVDDFCDFLAGRADPMIRRSSRRRCSGAAGDLDFETAARLRDDLGAMRRALEKQSVVLAGGTDADVVGIVGDELQASVQIFHVRGGRVRGERGWIVDVDANSRAVPSRWRTSWSSSTAAAPPSRAWSPLSSKRASRPSPGCSNELGIL